MAFAIESTLYNISSESAGPSHTETKALGKTNTAYDAENAAIKVRARQTKRIIGGWNEVIERR